MYAYILELASTPIYIGPIKQLLAIIVLAVIFRYSFALHKQIFPKDYFALNDIVYFFDPKHFWYASNFRFLLIAIIIIAAVMCFHVDFITVYCALILVGVVQVLPIISRYKLLKFWTSSMRFAYLLIDILYVVFLWLMGFSCLQFIIPAFTGGENIFKQDNQLVNFIIGLLLYFLPLIISSKAAGRADYLKDRFSLSRADFLHTDTLIMLRNLELQSRNRGGVYLNHAQDIKEYGEKFLVDSTLLGTILLIEEFNRGGMWQQLEEKLLVYFFPRLVLKKDMSLGPGQIRISTAAEVWGVSKGKALETVCNPLKNIETTARYIRLIWNKYCNEVYSNMRSGKSFYWSGHTASHVYEDWYDFLARHYIGASSNRVYECTLYAEILRWRCNYAVQRKHGIAPNVFIVTVSDRPVVMDTQGQQY